MPGRMDARSKSGYASSDVALRWASLVLSRRHMILLCLEPAASSGGWCGSHCGQVPRGDAVADVLSFLCSACVRVFAGRFCAAWCIVRVVLPPTCSHVGSVGAASSLLSLLRSAAGVAHDSCSSFP
jgi:hypothetical protein